MQTVVEELKSSQATVKRESRTDAGEVATEQVRRLGGGQHPLSQLDLAQAQRKPIMWLSCRKEAKRFLISKVSSDSSIMNARSGCLHGCCGSGFVWSLSHALGLALASVYSYASYALSFV